MGVDHPGGPGKGPETADKATSQGTRDQPPADSPGANGKTPRMDSLVAAGWKFPGRPGAADESTDPTGDKQQTLGDSSIEAKTDAKNDPEADEADVGSQLTNAPDDTVDPAETGNGGQEAEKRGQAKTEDPPQDEGERVDDNSEPAAGQPEASGPGGQDDHNKEPYSEDGGSSADDRTDGPEPPRQQESLPAANSAPPKPPSRLESLARARELQLQDAEQLRAKFQGIQAAVGDRGAPPQSENAGGKGREPEEPPSGTEAPPGGTDDDSAEPPAEPGADPPAPPEDQTSGEENKPQPGSEVGRPAETTAPPSEETGEHAASPEAQGGDKDAVGAGASESSAGEATAIEAVETETTEPQSAIDEELTDGEAAGGKPTRLEGRRDHVVDDPAVPGRTITDIDRIEDGVLWEEKSATNAGDIGRWVAKHIDKKFSSYLEARQYMVGYEQAPIGFHFTSSGADSVFRSEVESAVERLRLAYPSEQILLEWS